VKAAGYASVRSDIREPSADEKVNPIEPLLTVAHRRYRRPPAFNRYLRAFDGVVAKEAYWAISAAVA
jgi:hypothetical protein